MDPSDLENLTPEQIQQLVALGVIPDKQGDLSQQYEIANQLRSQATPDMRGNGRVMVAANPLEHLGTGLQRYAGQRDMKRIEGEQDALRKQQTAGREMFLRNYLFPAGPRPQSINGQVPAPQPGQIQAPMPKMSF